MELKNMKINGEKCNISLSFIFDLASSRLFYLSLHDTTGLIDHEYVKGLIKLLDEISKNLRETGHAQVDASNIGDTDW